MMMAPQIDPVALDFGAVKIHWYGLMYVIGFVALWWFASRRARRPGSGWSGEQVADAVFYGALGVILGGRLGYILFYKLDHYLAHPLDVLKIWEGGMSFHGGLLGVLVALWLFGRRHDKSFLQVTDFVGPWVPIGLGLGRLGNFINHELWGRVTDLPWGMVFIGAGDEPRHPSQLYQAFLEGAVLLTILVWYSRKPRPVGSVSGLFLLFYGLFRFLVEFVREPDAHLGLVLGPFSMGQLLSLPMIVAGGALFAWAHRRRA
jgi:phosphatidylglycerol---prolipoprotein diacylglyceryl transferase